MTRDRSPRDGQDAGGLEPPEAHRITVFLADDNVIVREGVRALLDLEDDLVVVGTADDYESLVAGAEKHQPQVVVTDIRMPPGFQREGIDAAKIVRKRHPGTGVVVLSQFDDPAYGVSLLSEGADGYAYLLKDRVGEGDQLARAVREVAAGGSVLDDKVVEQLTTEIRHDSALSADEEDLLGQVAAGRSIKAIAAARSTTPADVDQRIEALWVRLAQSVTAGHTSALERLKLLHRAIVDREEQGETLSRLLPGGLADKLRAEGRRIGETEELVVTVLMADIRGYSTIAERTDPSVLARQLSEHRALMTRAVLAEQGTIMLFIGDAVMAVFGAPTPCGDHADRALAAARAMHVAQDELNAAWRERSLEPFGLGIGLSTGPVAAALLGSEERLEYTVIGDTVNLSQRLQQWAAAGETVLHDATRAALTRAVEAETLAPAQVKGREAAVVAHRLPRRAS